MEPAFIKLVDFWSSKRRSLVSTEAVISTL